MAGNGVDADDVALHGGGKVSTFGFLVLEGDFVVGGLGFGGYGAPEGDPGGAVVVVCSTHTHLHAGQDRTP